MKFFLDENFPKTITPILIEKGHEVFDIRSTEYEGLDDNSLFKLAQDREAIFLTTDKDFFHTVPHLYKKHFGVIVIALRQPNRNSITEKFLFALNHFNLSLFKSKIILLQDNNFTVLEN